ncbi:MAG: hypothetical protein WBC06_12800, partial [Chitinophagaceae bacterium]
NMKKIFALLVIISLVFEVQAQKKNKGKTKDKNKQEQPTNYSPEDPVPDTLTKFTGIIKYRITSDDPSDRDSMFITFGENKIRITMFIPGYRADQIFENNMIANFGDSTLLTLDGRNRTYKTEKFSTRNAGTEFEMGYFKKSSLILNFPCDEYSGQMITKDEDVFKVVCLVSKKHSFIPAMDYNFLNIQPVILGYKIVLGYKTRTAANENTYIVAYKIEPGNTETAFDLSQFQPQ